MSEQSAVKAIVSVVEDEFQKVNQEIFEQLESNVPLVEKIGHYIIESGGKRLRPLLVLLGAGACGYRGETQIKLATVIEFLHTATLLHDDVVDTSDLRRGRPTANAHWGNAPSVLVGDFLYSRAFQLMVSMESMPIMQILSSATRVIAEGEVMQLMNIRNLATREADYMETIRCKTAMLFEASIHAAAELAAAPESQKEQLRRYGHHLGMAFQLVDDLLDYRGNAAEMGKNVGDDLAEGKPTLPLIHCMAHGTAEQAALVRQAILDGGLEQIEAIQAAVSDSGALDYTARRAQEEADQAIACLTCLPESPYRTALTELARFSVARTY